MTEEREMSTDFTAGCSQKIVAQAPVDDHKDMGLVEVYEQRPSRRNRQERPRKAAMSWPIEADFNTNGKRHQAREPILQSTLKEEPMTQPES